MMENRKILNTVDLDGFDKVMIFFLGKRELLRTA